MHSGRLIEHLFQLYQTDSLFREILKINLIDYTPLFRLKLIQSNAVSLLNPMRNLKNANFCEISAVARGRTAFQRYVCMPYPANKNVPRTSITYFHV